MQISAMGVVNMNGQASANGGSGSGGVSGGSGGSGSAGSSGSGGSWGAAGSTGSGGSRAGGGGAAGAPTVSGSAGGNGQNTSVGVGGGAGGGGGGGGGTGGIGGAGGRGGAGGTGGTGGGGAGGTLSVVGTAVTGTGSLSTAGGTGAASGANGRVIVGSNAGTGNLSLSGVATSVTTAGSAGVNPFLFGASTGQATPNLPGLQGGAEAFGLLSGPDAASVLGLMGHEGYAAFYRFDNLLGKGIGSLDYDFQGYDVVLLVNGGGDILNPKVGLGGSAADNSASLLLGGWANDELFGGQGDLSLNVLRSGDVYVLLVPEDIASLSFLSDNTRSVYDAAFLNGEMAPVPLPAAFWLLGSSCGMLVLRRRVRGHGRGR